MVAKAGTGGRKALGAKFGDHRRIGGPLGTDRGGEAVGRHAEGGVSPPE